MGVPGEDEGEGAKRPAFPSFGEGVAVWLRIALLSFGGPAGQIAVMHRILVEEKRWLGEARFLHALNFCMLLPGPEAQQLAIYIGWLMHRTLGGLLAGTLFVLPGLVAIMVLSVIYAFYGDVGPIEALFFGLKAGVLAIVLHAVVRIGKRALSGSAMVAIAALSFVAIFFFDVAFPLIIAGAALLGVAGHRLGLQGFAAAGHGDDTGPGVLADKDSALGESLPDHARPNRGRTLRTAGVVLILWLAPTALLLLTLGSTHVFSDIALFFSKMAVVTFGGAYAVLAYVAQEAVMTYGWLGPGEMLDGLGMAETTPGPLIMVTQFVGFMGAFRQPGGLDPLTAGMFGGLLTTWVTFAPCFLWIFVGAPFVERLRQNRLLSAALAAITAAVVGVILNLAVWFALHVLFGEVALFTAGPVSVDVPVLESVNPLAAALCALCLAGVFWLRAGLLWVLLGAGLAGLGLHLAGFVA
jgi:chromate transporter